MFRALVFFFLTALYPIAIPASEVTPTEIFSPGTMEFGPFAPSARYLEKDETASPGINLIYEITNMYSALPFKSDTLAHDFYAGEQYDAVFPIVDDLTPGGYIITFWAEDEAGNDISNPRGTRTFGYTNSGIFDQTRNDPVTLETTYAGSLIFINIPGVREICVVDASGRIVDLLRIDGKNGSITWGVNRPPGVYFVIAETGDRRFAKKVILIR